MLPSLMLALLSGLLLSSSAAAKTVTLRTGRAELKSVHSGYIDQNTAVTKTAADQSGTASGSAYATASAWGDGPQLRLFLISYNNNDHATAITTALTSNAGIVLSYIPVNNLLVVARAQDALAVAKSLAAEAAEYGPEHKVAPEWTPILDAVAAAAKAALAAVSGGTNEETAAFLAQKRADSLLGGLSAYTPAVGNDKTVAIQYGIQVELVPGLPASAPRAAAVDWPSAIPTASAAGGCRASVLYPAGESSRVSVFLCKEDLASGLAWLAELSVVRWVAPLRPVRRDDIAVNALVQRGKLSYDDLFHVMDANRRPYWTAGLMGQGEIIGVSDTGLEVENCNFRDPRFPGTYAAAFANRSALPTIGLVSYKAIPEHRKVVQYGMVIPGDFNDTDGHGTLCSSTAAGSILVNETDPLGPFELVNTTGAAPLARLSFVDTESAWYGGFLLPPDDVTTYLLPAHRLAGARILSDSWGIPGGVYDSQTGSYDLWLWQNPEMVSCMAAGNAGEDVLAPYTVTPPSVGKNVISVGAVEPYPQLPLNVTPTTIQEYFITFVPYGDTTGANAVTIRLLALDSRDGPQLASLLLPTGTQRQQPKRMVLASPIDACAPLNNARKDVAGKLVVVLSRYACGTDTSLSHIEAAGGAAMLMVDPTTRSITDFTALPVRRTDGGQEVNGTTPFLVVAVDIGVQIVGSLGAGDTLLVSAAKFPAGYNTTTSFSGWGPTADGRIKPDIVAPGSSITSSPDSHTTDDGSTCGSESWDGTSAATPLAAGTLALARQYLREGFYPTGSPLDTASAPFIPSGILLKALIIAGAASMEGGYALSTGQRLGPAPDGYQGWGRMSLAGALPLFNTSAPGVALQLADWGNFTKEGSTAVLKGINATGAGPVTIVLAWYDYPADVNAGPSLLVNDLDLKVQVRKTVSIGNAKEGARAPRADRLNTVERVLLKRPPAGAPIQITVKASHLGSTALDPNTPQRWALAVVGHIKGTLASQLNPAWAKGQAS